MRVIGIILVLIGGLTLGYQGFETRIRSTEQETDQSVTQKESGHLSPVAGGIALVSGLLLLASNPRREEN